MLVMKRKNGEGILITAPDGTEIRIWYEKNHHSNPEFLIDGPRDYTILRIGPTYNPVIQTRKQCKTKNTNR